MTVVTSELKRSNRCRMLIAEDDPAIQDCLVAVISAKYPDLDLYVVDDGEAGVALFKNIHPHIVLTDINMPRMNGLRMVEEIRRFGQHVQIIVLTATSESSEIIESVRLGINRYVLKPVEFRLLFEAIDDSVRRFEETTERQRAEERLRRRTLDLESAIRDQEAFSYSVSHDLRAPLRHINSYSTILEESLGSEISTEGKHCLDRIKAATRRMANLIDHLLELSRISRLALKRERVDLSCLATEIAESFRDTDPKRHVEVLIEGGLQAKGDRILLRQVLENLISNAWKYTSLHHAARIEVGKATINRQQSYFVKDNGIGFDMELSPKLFQIFERLHGPEFDGLGIGLATVQRIIHRHHGKIWAESSPGEGATFYFTV